jgi:RNA polymerase sigma-70 factor (ECF subfamily)
MLSTILQRLADGDADAVDECLAKYGGVVWSLARRWCPTHEDAEDAVQEVFLDVCRSAVKFDPDLASESTYITMIARRRLIDRYRHSRRHLGTVSLTREVLAADECHEERVEIHDEAAQAHKYIQQLRPAEREVLKLSIKDGMSQSQVAKSMNLPLGTVKTHARRGLIKLRELLGVDEASGVTIVGA